ncbi:MAG TPA: SpoIID/LytB domain-containing protein [Actinomycetota bacterium]|nr:SpoIID/LytB domain-containing protein [Actinomycetota bacterium]
MPRRSRWPAHILLLATVAALLGGPTAVRPAALAADPSASDPFAPAPGRRPAAQAPARAPAAAPAAFRISGGGYGHGVGMGQYGAYGMALRGRSAAAIVGFYYGGAAARRVALPAAIRVGVLQAPRDPSTGGRLTRVLVRGLRLPGHRSTGTIAAGGIGKRHQAMAKGLPANVTYAVRPDRGGVSVFAGSKRVFGPTLAGTGVRIRYQEGMRLPALLSMPQAGRTLRWGRLEVSLVRERSAFRLRAVVVMAFNTYLRGLAEMPSSWPAKALQAQAIAGRSYALATVRKAGQHRARSRWDGCDCGVYASVRDQNWIGWSKEAGPSGGRWVAAVRATGSLAVVWRGRLVQAFYSSSSGGHTAAATTWGGPSLPWLPARADPDDAVRGHNPNHRWTVVRSAANVSAALRRYHVGTVVGLRVSLADGSGRARSVQVRGTARSVTLAGGTFRSLLRLKSTRFRIAPVATG